MKEGLNKALIKVANSKLANSTIQKVSTTVKNAVKLTKKLALALKATITHIIQILLFFISPIGWIIIGGFVAILLGISISQTWGPQEFKQDADSSTLPAIQSLKGEEKEKVIMITLSQKGVKPEVAAYITQLIMESKESFSYGEVNGQTITNCDTSCLALKLKNGEIKGQGSIKLGILGFQDTLAANLVYLAKDYNKEWTDSSMQFQLIADALELDLSHYDSSKADLTEQFNRARTVLGLDPLPASTLKPYIDKAKTLSKKYEKQTKKVKVFGDGSSKGRLDGGGAGSGGIGSGSERLHFPAKGVYTSMYGPRVDPISGQNWFHTGVDIAGSGDIKAALAGKVIMAKNIQFCGNGIKIEHGKIDGVPTRTMYCHLAQIYVREGQDVSQGQPIGLMGTTGWSTGVHLHFEVHKNAKDVDPKPYLDKATPY